MRDIRAASMALRNSDYADGELKRELISKIITAWEQISQVIVAISPVLAADGSAGCGGAGFVLSGDFGDDFDEKIKKIILKIPENILNWFQHDIASMKLGPLFNNNIEGESSRFKKHLVALLIVHVRPNNWKDSLLSYIKSLHKNSYYLYDLFSALNIQYSYSYANTKELKDIAYLIKACIAKHDTGVELPGVSAVKKVPNDILPERNLD
ncbi:MAG: hypothetical protein SNJ29_13625 [Rikenellaceae bacterium]